MRESRFSVTLPAGWSYKVFWINFPETPPLEATAALARWTLNDLKPVKLERNMPPWRGIAGRMVISLQPPDGRQGGFQSWKDVGNWYLGLTNGRREASADIRQKVQDLTRNSSTPLAKMQALAEFAQQARLADPGIADDEDGLAAAALRHSPRALERAEDVVAADERRQPLRRPRLQATHLRFGREELRGRDRLRAVLHGDAAELAQLEVGLDLVRGRLGHRDRPGRRSAPRIRYDSLLCRDGECSRCRICLERRVRRSKRAGLPTRMVLRQCGMQREGRVHMLRGREWEFVLMVPTARQSRGLRRRVTCAACLQACTLRIEVR